MNRNLRNLRRVSKSQNLFKDVSKRFNIFRKFLTIICFLDILFEQGNGIYVSMEAVATNQGSVILKDETDSLQLCEKLCENHSGCHSFKYCKKGPQGKQCSLTDEPLTGNEPTIFEEECASYYTAGIRFSLVPVKLFIKDVVK